MTPNPEQNTLNHEAGHAPEVAATKIAEAQIATRLDYSLRHSGDYGLIVQSNLKAIFQDKANELRAETETFNENVALNMQKNILDGLNHRLDLIMSMATKDGTVSTPAELAQLNQGIAILQSTDVQGLVVDYLKAHNRPELLKTYLEQIGRQVEPDVVALLQKMNNGSPLDEKDWAVMTHYATEIANNTLEGPQKGMVIALVGNLKTGDRLTLLDKMANLNPPVARLDKFIENATVGGYLTTDQIQYFLQQHPKVAEAYPTLLATLSSPEMRKRQEAVENGRTKLISKMKNGVYGQRNSARELLTFDGIGGMAVAATGAMTITANVLMDIAHPADLLGNRALLLGAAELGVGMEMSNGMAGLATKPSTILANLGKEKEEEKTDEFKLKEKALYRSFGNYPLEAKFYYTATEKITKAYAINKDFQHDTHPKITMEDLKIKWEDLPKEYREGSSKAILEAKISDWAGDFVQNSHTEGYVNQQAKMDAAYRERINPNNQKLKAPSDPQLDKLLKLKN